MQLSHAWCWEVDADGKVMLVRTAAVHPASDRQNLHGLNDDIGLSEMRQLSCSCALQGAASTSIPATPDSVSIPALPSSGLTTPLRMCKQTRTRAGARRKPRADVSAAHGVSVTQRAEHATPGCRKAVPRSLKMRPLPRRRAIDRLDHFPLVTKQRQAQQHQTSLCSTADKHQNFTVPWPRRRLLPLEDQEAAQGRGGGIAVQCTAVRCTAVRCVGGSPPSSPT